MVEYVKLNKEDLQVLIEISQQIVDYKSRKLSRTSWNQFESIYLPSLVQQLADNQFKVVKAYSNTFRWLINQIQWSRAWQQGVRPENQCELAQTELGRRAIEICEIAACGQTSYDLRRSSGHSHDLYSIE